MAYAVVSKDRAVELADQLQVSEPMNKFEVTPHSWRPGYYTRLADGSVNEEAARTWGVVRWVPYCETVPWRNAGFVWFYDEPSPDLDKPCSRHSYWGQR